METLSHASSSPSLEREHRFGSGAFALRDLTLVRGRGARVWDDSGREYLDATGMYGVASIGHAHPRWVEAIRDQAERLGACFGTFANDRRAALLERLGGLLGPAFPRFFLCNSGTEAIEAALKTSRLVTGRSRVVALEGAFHGRTFGALSATYRPAYRTPFEPLVPGFSHVAFGDLEALDRAIDGETAAFVLEPVQGEGGVREVSLAYQQRARQLCAERGALLIYDEVQTGFGRTGDWFAFQRGGVVPDLLCLAKGIAGGFPMGALALGDRVGAIEATRHGSTFGGNPLACAAALATLDVLRDEGLVDRSRVLGEALRESLRGIGASSVVEVRGQGLLIGIELDRPAGPVVARLQQEGMLVLTAGPQVVRLLPPLVIRDEEVELLADGLRKVLGSL